MTSKPLPDIVGGILTTGIGVEYLFGKIKSNSKKMT